MGKIVVRNKKYWKKKPGTYIGRPTILGNPFAIGKDGSRDEVCEKYDGYAVKQMQNSASFAARIRSLAEQAKNSDLNLLCWCAPERCHGHTIKKLIEAELAKEI